jgi:SAM-dependent methyltransferase
MTTDSRPSRFVSLTPTGLKGRIAEAVSWRWRFVVAPWIKRLFGVPDVQWGRVVSNREGEHFIRSLNYRAMDVVEISPGGDRWKVFPFKSYTGTSFPAYDLCAGPLEAEGFDLVIAEQVLEHVHWPYRAVRSVWQMLRPGGWFLAATPFLLRVHDYPDDCSRWTEHGLKYLLIEGGFPEEGIQTGSWGNRGCVRANFSGFPSWIPWWHSLHNEPLFPITVWAFARKQQESRGRGGELRASAPALPDHCGLQPRSDDRARPLMRPPLVADGPPREPIIARSSGGVDEQNNKGMP